MLRGAAVGPRASPPHGCYHDRAQPSEPAADPGPVMVARDRPGPGRPNRPKTSPMLWAQRHRGSNLEPWARPFAGTLAALAEGNPVRRVVPGRTPAGAFAHIPRTAKPLLPMALRTPRASPV